MADKTIRARFIQLLKENEDSYTKPKKGELLVDLTQSSKPHLEVGVGGNDPVPFNYVEKDEIFDGEEAGLVPTAPDSLGNKFLRSDGEWIKIEGSGSGSGIGESIPLFLATDKSKDVTVEDSGWTRTPQNVTNENKYLWTYNAEVDNNTADRQIKDLVNFEANAENLPLKSLKVKINPLQNLQGYNEPWAGGMKENLLPINPLKNTDTVNDVKFTVVQDSNGNNIGITCNGTATASTDYTFASVTLLPGTYVLQKTGINGVYIGVTGYAEYAGENSDLTLQVNTQAEYDFWINIPKNVNISSKTLKPLLRIKKETDDQDIDFIPYSNICPIKSHKNCIIKNRGKNIIDFSKAVGISNNVTVTIDTNINGFIVYSDDQSATYQNASFRNVMSDELLVGHTYILSSKVTLKSGRRAMISFRDQSGYIRKSTYIEEIENSKRLFCKFKITEPNFYVSFFCNGSIPLEGGTISGTTYEPIETSEAIFEEVMLEEVSEETTQPSNFIPFNKQNIYTISLENENEDVYSGELDVITGKLTLDKKLVKLGILYASSYNIDKQGDEHYHYNAIFFPPSNLFSDMDVSRAEVEVKSNAGIMGTLADCYSESAEVENLTVCKFLNNKTGKWDLRIAIPKSYNVLTGYVKSDNQEDYGEIQTFIDKRIGKEGIKILYPIADPITYQLTPMEVLTLLGDNNIWADTGDVDVTYYTKGNISSPSIAGIYTEEKVEDRAPADKHFYTWENKNEIYVNLDSILETPTLADGDTYHRNQSFYGTIKVSNYTAQNPTLIPFTFYYIARSDNNTLVPWPERLKNFTYKDDFGAIKNLKVGIDQNQKPYLIISRENNRYAHYWITVYKNKPQDHSLLGEISTQNIVESFSYTSPNPYEYETGKTVELLEATRITFPTDELPTPNSNNLVTSGGIAMSQNDFNNLKNLVDNKLKWVDSTN